MTEYHVLNLGAGVQSTTLYLMAVRNAEPRLYFDAAVFADTQEEPEAVYAHLEWLKSLAGPPIIVRSAGCLGDHLIAGRNSTGGRFAAIPAFTTDGESHGQTKRQCSKEYKTEVIGKSIRQDVLGLAPGRHVPKGVHVVSYIGISADEAGRATNMERRHPPPRYGSRRFPLCERNMTRASCRQWLETHGQVPHEVPRSACVFCPFHADAEWLRIRENPRDWARAVQIDEALRTTGTVANRDYRQTMYLHRSLKPLAEVEFKPKTNPRELQFGLTLAWIPECEGVCGV